MSNKIIHLSLLFIISLLYVSSFTYGQSIDDGKKFLKNESFVKATLTFKTIAEQSNNPEAWYYLGQTYFEKENFDSAKFAYQKGIAAKSDYGLNYTGLAKTLFRTKNVDEGEKNIAAALKIGDESDIKIFQAAADAYIKGGKDLSVKAKDLIDKAMILTKKAKKKDKTNFILLGDMYNVENNGSAAVENYKKAIDIDSTAEAFVSIGKIFEIIRNFGEAELSFTQAMKVDPAYAPAYKGMAELENSLRKYDSAIENWKNYIQYSENSPENQKRLINFVYLSKDYKSAADLINASLKDDPNSSYLNHMLAYSYSQLNDTTNGIPAFNKFFAVAKDSQLVVSDHEYFAKLLISTKQDSLAVIELQKAIKMDTTKRPDLHSNIAVLCFKMKNWDCVISEYDIKLKLAGNLSATEYFDLGKAYYFKNDLIKADTAFASLIQAKPDLMVGYHWRALINATLDSTSEKGLARPFYEKIISMAQGDSIKYKKDLIDAYHYLGFYYYLQKDDCTARSYYQKVLILAPDDKPSIEAVKKLKKC